ncbi:MAG TPA: hypothetical protein VGC58_01615 [Candidatus Paceibacterota bacterium]
MEGEMPHGIEIVFVEQSEAIAAGLDSFLGFVFFSIALVLSWVTGVFLFFSILWWNPTHVLWCFVLALVAIFFERCAKSRFQRTAHHEEDCGSSHQ